MKALLMLLVLGLVLPVAEASVRFCLCANRIVVAEVGCCGCEDESSCDSHGECPHDPSQPSCSIALKPLPDGVPSVDFVTPLPVVAEIPPVTFQTPAVLSTDSIAADHPRGRAPPDGPPRYLIHRALLL